MPEYEPSAKQNGQAGPGSSSYLDSVAESILLTVTSFELLAGSMTEAARDFSARADEFARQVARLKAIAGLVQPHSGEQ